MILISFAFAWVAFIIASNYFASLWAWLGSGIVSFILTYLAFSSGNDTLIIIWVAIFALLLIATWIKKSLE